jgi:hypothetical protein
MEYADIRGTYGNKNDDYKNSNNFSKDDGSDRMEYGDIRGTYDNVDNLDSDTRGYSNSDENVTRFNDTGYNSNDISDMNRSIRGDQKYGKNSYDDMRYQECSDDEDKVGCDTQDEVPPNHPHESYHGSSSDPEPSRDQVISAAPETLSDQAGSWYAKFANKKITEETIEAPSIQVDRDKDNEIADFHVDIKNKFPTERYDKKNSSPEMNTPTVDVDTREKDGLGGKRLYEEGNNRNSYTDLNNRNIKDNRYDRKMEMYYRAEDDTDSRVRDVQSSWDDSRERRGGQGSSRYSSTNPRDNYDDKSKEYDRDRSNTRGASNRMDNKDRDFTYDRQSSSGTVRRGSKESYHRLLLLKLIFSPN